MSFGGDNPKLNLNDHIKDWQFWVVVLLASQFVIIQLITHVQYFDGLRNLHWGTYLLEEPGFMIGGGNRYDKIYGFRPDPPSLAAIDLPRDEEPRFHPWWGPLFPVFVALIYKFTNSNLLIQMIAPVCGGILVVFTYLFGVQYLNKRIGFMAAFFLSMLPIFREHVVMAYTEPIAGLLLFGSFWAHVQRRTKLTVVFGSLAVLVKIDLIFIYIGTIFLTEMFAFLKDRQSYNYRHGLSAIIFPGIFALWPLVVTLLFDKPLTLSGLPSYDLFVFVSRLALQQFFPIHPLFTYLTLVLIGICIIVALSRHSYSSLHIYRLLGVWLILGCIALLIYLATPGASNNPRVIIPSLPALCLLLSAGTFELSIRKRMVIEGFFIVIFLLTSFATTLYQVIQAENSSRAMPVWEYLEDQPSGFVMTDHFWEAIFYAHQPATWFFEDEQFERNILYDLENFISYTSENPIRYLVFPLKDDSEGFRKSELVQLYARLPLGRMLDFRDEPMISEAVREYIDNTYRSKVIGDYIVYTLY